jgi:probable F420-dependent oxidoreductase
VSTIVGQRVGFGIVFGFGLVDPGRLAADVRQAETLGFDMVSFPDHLHGERPSVEPWTALTWAAAATERIAVMPNVLALPYRAPAVTAKMAETLDRLSSGRLVLGLGTGGYDAEFAAFGLAERTPGQKVSALAEALRIVRGLWSDPSVTFNGTHYHVHEARIEPRPERPIPVWLGSYGPRGLRLTGALADGWIPSLGRVDLDQLRAMRAEVRAAAEAAGRDPDEITCAVNLVVAFGGPGYRDTPPATGSSSAWRPVSGGSEAIAEQLIGVVQAGFTFLNVVLDDPADRERFASEVIPVVRRQTVALGPVPAGTSSVCDAHSDGLR